MRLEVLLDLLALADEVIEQPRGNFRGLARSVRVPMFNVEADASGVLEMPSGNETAPQPLEDPRRLEAHADVFLPARSRKSSRVRELSITTGNTESEGVRVAVRDARDPRMRDWAGPRIGWVRHRLR
jgi:hypothetical protein